MCHKAIGWRDCGIQQLVAIMKESVQSNTSLVHHSEMSHTSDEDENRETALHQWLLLHIDSDMVSCFRLLVSLNVSGSCF